MPHFYGVVLVEPKAVGIGTEVTVVKGLNGNAVLFLDPVVMLSQALLSCSLRIRGEGGTYWWETGD